MPTAMHEVTRLTPTEKTLLFSGRDLWGSNKLGDQRLHVRPSERRFVRYADVEVDGVTTQQPVAHVGMVRVVAFINGSPTPTRARLVGLGQIVTRRGFREQGHARALINYVLETLTAEGAELAVIFCLDHRLDFYRRGGWTPWETVDVHQPTSPPHRTVTPPYHCLYRTLGGAMAGASVDASADAPADGRLYRHLEIEGLPW